MNIIKAETLNAFEIIEKTSDYFNLEIKELCNAKSVFLPDNLGLGTLTSLDGQTGVSVLLVEATFHSNVLLDIYSSNPYPLIFMHCTSGNLVHKFCDDNLHYNLEVFQSSISSCPCSTGQSFLLPAERKISAVFIFLDRENFKEIEVCTNDALPQPLADSFEDKKSENTFLYQGRPEYRIAEILQELFATDLSKPENYLLSEAKIYEMMGVFLKNYRDSFELNSNKVMLSDYDLDCIETAREIIERNLNNPPIIPELAKQVGINQQKLKQGFKTVFGTTINQFVIKSRMKIAKELLGEGDISIRETAQRVGYTNQSHFSSKFREHYGLLPKDFVKNRRQGQR